MKKVLIFGFSLFVIMFFTRCTIQDDLAKLSSFATDSLKIVLGTPEFSHTIHFEVRDAATQGYITSNVKIKLSGAGARKVYSNLGEQPSDSTFTAVMGILDLVLDPRIDSASLAANPVSFNITPVADGYVGVQQTVKVSNEKFKIVEVSMINLSGPQPSGVSVSQASLSPAYNGDQTSNSVLQQIDGMNTTIEVQPNTTLKNASGQVLKGNISSQVVFYNPTDPVAQNMLAGALTGPVQLENNSTVDSKLVSAGMYTAELKVGSETVKTLNGEGLKLKTRVPDDLINPKTGNTIQEGDIIPMWSKEENSGTWKFEKNSVVKKDADGFYLEDLVNHLSYWNWDWVSDSNDYYDFGPVITWNLVNFKSGQVNIEAHLNKSGVNYGTRYEAIYNNSTSDFLSTPMNVSGYLKITDRAPVAGRHLTFSPDSIPFTDLSRQNYNVKVTATYDPTLYTADITVKIHSDDPTDKTIIMPSTFINYSQTTPLSWIPANMKNGLVSVQLLPGTNYSMLGIFGGKWVFGTFRLNDIGNGQLQFVFSDFTSTVNNITSDPIDRPADGSSIEFTYNVTVPASTFGSFKKVGRPIQVNK
ncbi:MAG: hypothetical protein WCS79_10780 [Paludibacter sp.]